KPRAWAASCTESDFYTRADCAREQDRSLYAASLFLRDSLDWRAVVATEKPAAVHLFGNRRTVPLTVLSARGAAPDSINVGGMPLTHILLTHLVETERAVARRELVPHCSRYVVAA